MFKCELPSGKEVVMKPLTYRDRQAAVRMFKSGKEEGYMLEELLASMAIVSDGGFDVSTDLVSDPIERMNNWSIPDVQYYLEFFMTINSLDEKLKKSAEEQAKKLMGATSTTKATTSKAKAA